MDNKNNKDTKLSNEQQIQVIRRAIVKYEEQYTEKHDTFRGLCYYLQKALFELYNIEIKYYEVEKYIPLFNHTNAVEYGQASKDHTAEWYKISYWWSVSDHKSRLKFMNWMLKELNKELNKEVN